MEKDLLELLKKMLYSDPEKKKGREGLEVDQIEPDSPHGIYVYDFNKENGF